VAREACGHFRQGILMIYEYECGEGHVSERRRKIADRALSVVCHCGKDARLIISHNHVPPSGVYSYMPNLGSARDFERRQNALETGQRVIKRTFDDNA
jgi:hypothetical protein